MEEVDEAYTRAEEFEPMVQELIPGGDDTLYTVGSYLDRNGRPLGVFSGRKLRQTPPGVGTCRVGEALWVQDAVDAALRLLAAFDYVGLSQVEFKRDPRDGKFKLMEINPRLWQWHSLAAACGVDLPRIAYADLVGETPAEADDERGRQALGDHADAGREPRLPATSLRRRRLRAGRSKARRGPPRTRRAERTPMIPASIERRARWVLDSIGATDVGFGDDVPYDADAWERVERGERPRGRRPGRGLLPSGACRGEECGPA